MLANCSNLISPGEISQIKRSDYFAPRKTSGLNAHSLNVIQCNIIHSAKVFFRSDEEAAYHLCEIILRLSAEMDFGSGVNFSVGAESSLWI